MDYITRGDCFATPASPLNKRSDSTIVVICALELPTIRAGNQAKTQYAIHWGVSLSQHMTQPDSLL